VDAFTRGDILGLASVYGYIVWVLVVAWVLRDRVKNLRKIIHVLTGGIVFFWWMFDSRLVMAGLAAFPFVLLLLLATPKSPVKFLRNSPLGARSSEGHPYGLVMYAISWTMIAYILFDDLMAASVAIAAMAFGDGMGEVIGRKYGARRYMPNRTLEGSAAVFLATTISIIVLSWFYFDFVGYTGGTAPELLLLFSPVMGLLVSILEAVTPGSIDNLVIPLTVAGFLHLMGV
jgi:phytol kinase